MKTEEELLKEKGVTPETMREIKVDIGKLKAIINKKDDWRLVEVPDNIWQDLYEEKALLMADMMRFAYIRNEDAVHIEIQMALNGKVEYDEDGNVKHEG